MLSMNHAIRCFVPEVAQSQFMFPDIKTEMFIVNVHISNKFMFFNLKAEMLIKMVIALVICEQIFQSEFKRIKDSKESFLAYTERSQQQAGTEQSLNEATLVDSSEGKLFKFLYMHTLLNYSPLSNMTFFRKQN